MRAVPSVGLEEEERNGRNRGRIERRESEESGGKEGNEGNEKRRGKEIGKWKEYGNGDGRKQGNGLLETLESGVLDSPSQII